MYRPHRIGGEPHVIQPSRTIHTSLTLLLHIYSHRLFKALTLIPKIVALWLHVECSHYYVLLPRCPMPSWHAQRYKYIAMVAELLVGARQARLHLSHGISLMASCQRSIVLLQSQRLQCSSLKRLLSQNHGPSPHYHHHHYLHPHYPLHSLPHSLPRSPDAPR